MTEQVKEDTNPQSDSDPLTSGRADLRHIFSLIAEKSEQSPVGAFDEGLKTLQCICHMLISHYAGPVMYLGFKKTQVGAPSDETSEVKPQDERWVNSICRLMDSYTRIGEARVRLRTNAAGGIAQ